MLNGQPKQIVATPKEKICMTCVGFFPTKAAPIPDKPDFGVLVAGECRKNPPIAVLQPTGMVPDIANPGQLKMETGVNGYFPPVNPGIWCMAYQRAAEDIIRARVTPVDLRKIREGLANKPEEPSVIQTEDKSAIPAGGMAPPPKASND